MKKGYKRAIFIIPLIMLLICFNNKITRADSRDREVRGVWVTTLYNKDWPSQTGLSIEEQKNQMINNLSYIKNMNLNTMYFQVRSLGDAMYSSQYAPWSSFLTGELGRYPGYDPLQFAVQEAHNRKIEFHPWFNPFRIGQGSTFNLTTYLDKLPSSSPLKNNPQWIVNYDGYYCINPGIPEAREYVINVIMEVVKNYDVDGIHLDDYFYPYPKAGVDFNDSSEYQKYGSEFTDKGDWRRNNVNEFIRSLNLRIKSEKPYIKFGVSPFGIWKNGTSVGGSDTSGLSSYDSLYVDSLKWVNEKWIDYIVPQVYWNIGYGRAAYDKLVKWWSDNTRNKNVDLIIGQAAYKVGDINDETPWMDQSELINQINLNRTYSNINGSSFFTLSSLKENKLGVSERIYSDLFQTPSQITRNKVQVAYSTHVQNVGWSSESLNSYISGTEGRGLRIEGIKINLENQPANLSIKYRAHVENVGWQPWVNGGELAGTEGKSLRVEAFQVKLEGYDANKYTIEYQAHVQDIGWMPWVKNGQTSGTEGLSKRVEAIRIRIYENPLPIIYYQSHVQDIGWMNQVYNEQISGTVGMGKRVEAMKISIKNNNEDLRVKYTAHVENIGWQPWVTDGTIIGTEGKGYRTEAFRILLEGNDSTKYNVLYQAHVQDIGWMPWVSNGEIAGTSGQGKRVEAIRVKILKK